MGHLAWWGWGQIAQAPAHHRCTNAAGRRHARARALQAALFRRNGLLAPILVRVGNDLVWHILCGHLSLDRLISQRDRRGRSRSTLRRTIRTIVAALILASLLPALVSPVRAVGPAVRPDIAAVGRYVEAQLTPLGVPGAAPAVGERDGATSRCE